MFYIKLNIDGVCKYLLNECFSVYLCDYATKFDTEAQAQAYMSGKQVAKERHWWTVER